MLFYRQSDFIDLGCIGLEVRKQLLYKYRNDIHISPNGVVFLKDYVRKGILPKFVSIVFQSILSLILHKFNSF